MTWRRWRRVPGPGACDWCLMLASRGAVYKSKMTAEAPVTDDWHSHCGCGVAMETDRRAKLAVRIHPEDANRVITVRPATMPDRAYTYDLGTFARLEDQVPQFHPRPARQTVRPGKPDPYKPGARTVQRRDSLAAQFEQLLAPERAHLAWVQQRLREVAAELRAWFPPDYAWADETAERLRLFARAGVREAADELARRGLSTTP